MGIVTRLLIFFWAVAGVLVSSSAADSALAGPDVAKAQQFVLDGVARTSKILRSHTESRLSISDRLRAEFRRGFDIPAIANFALGSSRGKLSAEQRRLYEREFEELVVQTYTSRVIHYGPRVKSDISDIIRFTGFTPINENQVLLHSEVNRKGVEWVKINWRVRSRGDAFAILDIMILGISQAMLYKSEIESVVQRNGRGIDGLVDTLRKKNLEIRNGQ
jgi:phospholipid transport system substrate-binding protein